MNNESNKILYINSCVRDNSRTDRLAKALLKKIGDEYTELNLDELNLEPLNRERLEYRTKLIEMKNYEDKIFEYAKQFSNAETIVIAAPYWDESYPAILKIYLENIYVMGIVTDYEMDGTPKGLCSAKKLYYLTTAGGPYNPKYSYEHIKNLAVNMFGIQNTELIYVENLDISGNDAETLLKNAIESINGTYS